MLIARLAAVVIALLLAAQVVRSAVVAAFAPVRPEAAAKVWAAHPAVEISLGLAEIGRATRERQPIGQDAFSLLGDAAAKSPLSPEPFLVRGVQAQTASDLETAKQAFLAAQRRDPRSMPAAYFLADYYFRMGDALGGLRQAAVLARLSPNGTQAIAPFVATYAQDRSNWPKMRSLFRSQKALEGPVLAVLARDPHNADAILAVADPDFRNPRSEWLPILLSSLVSSGDYARARAIWSSIGAGGGEHALIFDAGFSQPAPPPPFNWSFASSTVGLAERQPGNRLHVLFYGNEDGALASELLMLPAGFYRVRMQLAALSHPEQLHWSIRCDKTSEPFATIGIDQALSTGWNFQVPSGCPAQWLELSGRSADVAQQSEATISGLTMTQAGPNG